MGPLRRRDLLVSGAALAVGCATAAPPPLRGTLSGHEAARRGHARPTTGAAPADETVDVAIVGAGVSGLSAAWRLAREGFAGSVAWLELRDRIGGTAAAASSPAGPHPLGAHYITLPNPEAKHVRLMLHEAGVIRGFDAEGRPRYAPRALCAAPQERLYVAGEWVEGLWPGVLADGQANAQRASFEAKCEELTWTKGADGRYVFAIPVALSSADPAFRRLAHVSFADWLDAQGYTAPVLRWQLRYACRDDFGTELEDTSAWAGLHYHCARRPDLSDDVDRGTRVLTWPGGNGWLVEHLASRVPWAPQLGSAVVALEPGAPTRLWVAGGGTVRRIDATHVVLAVPAPLVDRLLARAARPVALGAAPWRVASLLVDRLPASRGIPAAWDSVLYRGEGLGYVTSSHQDLRYGAGAAVMSWYEPLSTQPPEAGRRALLASSWEEEADRVMVELAQAHPDLRERVQQLDVHHWGHGTARPVVGLHEGPTLSLAAQGADHVIVAHTDLSGMSLFEEASWHGVRAAEQILVDRLGVVESLL